jgi:uncharacterized LabA/DUF88 family protein
VDNTTKETVYAFIDSQNLNLGIRSLGWKIDYRKFRLYLKNKFGVDEAFMFIGFVPDNQKLYTQLQKAGFILVYKTAVIYQRGGKTIIKGNVDAELVLHSAAIEYENYDKAIIVTNDGDFLCLVRHLNDKGKLLKILAPNKKYSTLFRSYRNKILTLDTLQGSLERKQKTGNGVQSKP